MVGGGGWAGQVRQTVSFGRQQNVGYANLRADEANFEQIKNALSENLINKSNKPNVKFENNGYIPYLDEAHANFSPELKIAINAWSDIYSNPQQVNSRGVKVTLKNWLAKNKIKLDSNAAFERIASVITPQKRKETGGVLAIQTDEEIENG